MRHIYESADHVMIHLGDVTSVHCQNVSTLLESVGWFLYNYRAGIKHPESPGTVHLESPEELDIRNFPKYGLPCVTDPQWQSLVSLLDHPWFWRLWVIQESLVAKHGTFIFGKGEIDLQVLYSILHDLSEFPNFANAVDRVPRPNPSPLQHAITRCTSTLFLQSGCSGRVGTKPVRMGDIRWQRRHLVHLLGFTAAANATDPRDYLFSLLGISVEADEPELCPNYTESTDQVYLKFSKYFIRQGHGPSLLCYCHKNASTCARVPEPPWIPVHLGPSLPSLVPRWNVDGNLWLSGLWTNDRSRPDVSAARKPSPRFEMSENGQELVIQGIPICTINRLGAKSPCLTEQERAEEASHFAIVLIALVGTIRLLEWNENYVASESDLEMISQFLVCDSWKRGNKKLSKRAMKQHLTSWLQGDLYHMKVFLPFYGLTTCVVDLLFVSDKLGVRLDGPQPIQYDPAEYVFAALHFAASARRCRTAEGYICQVPPEAEVGDKIVLASGCQMLYVLRPYFNGTSSFIGECYVQRKTCGKNWDEESVQEFRIV